MRVKKERFGIFGEGQMKLVNFLLSSRNTRRHFVSTLDNKKVLLKGRQQFKPKDDDKLYFQQLTEKFKLEIKQAGVKGTLTLI